MGNTNSERKKGSQVRASVFGTEYTLTTSSAENGFSCCGIQKPVPTEKRDIISLWE
jgi:hypothetical protein